MKYLAVLVILALSSGIGYAYPPLGKLRSSGVICKIDEEGHTAECDEENSQLPDNLNTNGAVASDEFTCLDVTYKTGFILKKTNHVLQCAYQLKGQRLCSVLKGANDVTKCVESDPEPKPTPSSTTPEGPSGLYCIVDDVDNTVECDKRNSILPNDVNAGKYSKTSNYVCLDLTYRVGLIPLQQTKHVRQCALEVNSEDGLCDVLQDNNDVASCTQSTPYNTATVEPPSNLYCEVDSEGDKVECSKANTVLPKELNTGGVQKTSTFVCLAVTYKTGIFPLEKTRTIQQCAYEVSGNKDLCSVLRDRNNIQKCREWDPSEGNSGNLRKH